MTAVQQQERFYLLYKLQPQATDGTTLECSGSVIIPLEVRDRSDDQ